MTVHIGGDLAGPQQALPPLSTIGWVGTMRGHSSPGLGLPTLLACAGEVSPATPSRNDHDRAHRPATWRDLNRGAPASQHDPMGGHPFCFSQEYAFLSKAG